MANYKTVILEDEGPARRRMEGMVLKHPALELIASFSTGRKALIQLPGLNPDVLLLDIQLKDYTAFDILDQLQDQLKSRIIFISAYDHYALKAFEVAAIDYLLKPFDFQRFCQSIDRVLRIDLQLPKSAIYQQIKENLNYSNKRIVIPEGKKHHFFLAHDILTISSDKYYSVIETAYEKKVIRITLKSIHQFLPADFIRINRSTIINFRKVKEFQLFQTSGMIHLNNGVQYGLTRNYLEAFKARINQIDRPFP